MFKLILTDFSLVRFLFRGIAFLRQGIYQILFTLEEQADFHEVYFGCLTKGFQEIVNSERKHRKFQHLSPC